MDWYTVIKTINRRRYCYRQKTWRAGKSVRCHSQYLGPCNTTLIGYHGTFAKLRTFNPAKLGSGAGGADTEAGFFFASNARVAISYASTELATQRGLDAKVCVLEHRIEKLTGVSWVEAEDMLADGSYADDKPTENRLKTYLLRRRRASERMATLYERGIFDELELSKRAHLKKCRVAFAKAYYVDNEHRRYSPWAYMRAIDNARKLGCDGVVIKNTYDMGTPSLYERDEENVEDLTDVYIAFDPKSIRTL
jgi:hypothetical protein